MAVPVLQEWQCLSCRSGSAIPIRRNFFSSFLDSVLPCFSPQKASEADFSDLFYGIPVVLTFYFL